jgi:hypothetical protein
MVLVCYPIYNFEFSVSISGFQSDITPHVAKKCKPRNEGCSLGILHFPVYTLIEEGPLVPMLCVGTRESSLSSDS